MHGTRWSLVMMLVLMSSAPHAQIALAPLELGADKCTPLAMGAPITPSEVGEPVSAVKFGRITWHVAEGLRPALCLIEGSILPVDTAATARAIRFAVALPGSWNQRSIHAGGGGMNGVVPTLVPNPQRATPRGLLVGDVAKGFAAYGSDSGHTLDEMQWALNDEAVRNFGYAQLKKTHDVAQILITRAYGQAPRFRYFVGNSQGGREGVTSAQRHPRDYHGIVADVPIVGLNGLMQAPAAIRRRELALADHVPQVKARAIAAEFMHRCDGLDGLDDAVINDYMACRRLFDVNDGKGPAKPWTARRCPDGFDPAPQDASENACLTDGQIGTLQFIFSRQPFGYRRAHATTHFGMWGPTTEVAVGGLPPVTGNSLLNDIRYRAQEGAAPDARMFSALGSIAVTGFLLRDLAANPLTYADAPEHRARQRLLSDWFDSTNPDLREFQRRGGKLISTIGTNDTLASSGAQLDYYEALVKKMGRSTLDRFARLYVLPQRGHGLQGSSYTFTGQGRAVTATPLPSDFDRLVLLQKWVESGEAPAKTQVVSGTGGRSGLMCSYPASPHYEGGAAEQSSAWRCR